MIFNNISFENYIPGLEKSEEIYFGTTAPLSQILLKFAKDIKEYIGEDSKKFKDKKWVKELFKITDDYGDKIANEINAEKVYLAVCADDEDNAFAENLIYDNDFLTKDKSTGTVYIDFDKIAKLEDIIICPNVGYKYRNSKGKIITIVITTGCIKNGSIEEIAGTLAHEIGHCFQQGIFGVYKRVADLYVTYEVKKAKKKVITLAESENPFIKFLSKLPFFDRLFKYIVVYNCFPGLLTKNLMESYRRNVLKSYFDNHFSNQSYLMKDKLQEMDNGKNTDLKDDKGNLLIASELMDTNSEGTDQKNKNGKGAISATKASFNDYKEFDLDGAIKKKTKNWIVNFFRSILVNLKYISLNRKNVISLSNYSANQYEKLSFYKKYEFFADIFATSYGFGPHLYRNYSKTEIENIKLLDKINIVGLNHIPMLRAIYKYNSYKYLRSEFLKDEHGTSIERGRAIYTSLMKELENNPDLTENQIKAIKLDINMLKESDEYFISEKKENGGFWYKVYNKMVSESINKIDDNVDEKILRPIQTICEESIKLDHLK